MAEPLRQLGGEGLVKVLDLGDRATVERLAGAVVERFDFAAGGSDQRVDLTLAECLWRHEYLQCFCFKLRVGRAGFG
jgi:hypothetical protein